MTPAETIVLERRARACITSHLTVLLRVADGDRHDWRRIDDSLRYAVHDLAQWGAIELTRDGLPLRITAYGRRLRDLVHRRRRGGGR